MSQQGLELRFITGFAYRLSWVSPFSGREFVAYGDSQDEAMQALRLKVLREFTDHGKTLAASHDTFKEASS